MTKAYLLSLTFGYYINEVDCVLTGAEVVLDDGSIINRTGTALIALYAY